MSSEPTGAGTSNDIKPQGKSHQLRHALAGDDTEVNF
jgi:hypothetical protein